MSECVMVVKGRRLGLVAASIADDPDASFRLAAPGEASIPALFEDEECEDCGRPDFSWFRISLDDMPLIEAALTAGCEPFCRCVCGHPVTT